jgi:hypothetical protein
VLRFSLPRTVSADELHTIGDKVRIVVIASFKYKYHCQLPIVFAFTVAIDFGFIPSNNYGLWQTEQVISAKFQNKVSAVVLKIFRRAL